MKNLVLASALGALAGTFVVPAIGGPIHYQVTRPFSMFGTLPPNTTGALASVTLGTAPLDFIVTDLMVNEPSLSRAVVTVNGAPILAWGQTVNSWATSSEHMTTGVFIPAGAVIGLQAIQNSWTNPVAVTIAGYVQ